MSDLVTLNVAAKNSKTNRTFSVQVENKNFINSIVTVKNGTITESDVKKIQQAAGRSGDYGVLENCDLNADEKLNLALANKYSKYYDISLSNDKKYFVVTVKETPWYMSNPDLGVIKSDFGIRPNVFVQKGEIKYGNEELINKRAEPGSTPDGRNTDYDAAKLLPGDTINIPVNEIQITGSPAGVLGRLF